MMMLGEDAISVIMPLINHGNTERHEQAFAVSSRFCW